MRRAMVLCDLKLFHKTASRIDIQIDKIQDSLFGDDIYVLTLFLLYCWGYLNGAFPLN